MDFDAYEAHLETMAVLTAIMGVLEREGIAPVEEIVRLSLRCKASIEQQLEERRRQAIAEYEAEQAEDRAKAVNRATGDGVS